MNLHGCDVHGDLACASESLTTPLAIASHDEFLVSRGWFRISFLNVSHDHDALAMILRDDLRWTFLVPRGWCPEVGL